MSAATPTAEPPSDQPPAGESQATAGTSREWQELRAATAWLRDVLGHPNCWVVEAAARRLLYAAQHLLGEPASPRFLDDERPCLPP